MALLHAAPSAAGARTSAILHRAPAMAVTFRPICSSSRAHATRPQTCQPLPSPAVAIPTAGQTRWAGCRAPGRNVITARAVAGREGSDFGSAGKPTDDDSMAGPNLTFPPLPFEWQKAPPKQSLVDRNLQDKAQPWILNLIETIHWASFPIGFYVVHFMFVHSAQIAPYVGNDPSRVFLLILGLLCQIFGGGISGNMMHTYEGWQVTPFRSPLALPDGEPVPPTDIEQIRVNNYNNAWLRSVAYQMLFLFQSVGLACFTAGAFGITPATTSLLAGSALVGVLGPHTPRPAFKINGEPVLPLSWSLIIVFAINVVFDLWGYRVMFGDAFAAHWPPTDLPFLAAVPKALVPWLPLVAPLAVAAGGAYEGAVAESSFNQWDHFIAFVVLTVGLIITGGMYGILIDLPAVA